MQRYANTLSPFNPLRHSRKGESAMIVVKLLMLEFLAFLMHHQRFLLLVHSKERKKKRFAIESS